MTLPSKPYAYNSPTHEDYKLVICCRFSLAFIVGYLAWAWCNASLAYLFNYLGIEKAESIFLAVVITLIFACIWVLSVFCVQSIIRVSIICLSFLAFFAILRFYIIN